MKTLLLPCLGFALSQDTLIFNDKVKVGGRKK